MVIGRNHLRFQINQSCKHTVQCHRICGHQNQVHGYWVSGARSISLHCSDSIHNIKSRLHILVQINKHPGEAVCAGIFSMTNGLIFPIYKSIAVLHCSCNSLQSVGFHFGKRNHTLCLQQFFRKDKFFRLDTLRIFHTHALRIVNGRDLVLLQISIHSGALDYLFRSPMTTGIRKHNILITFLT